MFDRFTERARKVMTLSRMEAQKLGHDYIGTEHLLLGLVQEGNGVAAQALKSLGAELRKIRAEVEKLVERGTTPASGVQLPFTPRMKRVFEYAIEEARGFGNNYIGTEHLLIGMIRENSGPGAQVLQNLGVGPEEIRRMVTELLFGDPFLAAPAGAAEEEARALVEAILLKRLHHAEPRPKNPGSVELEVRSTHGPKGWGFQLWLGHRDPAGELRTEMAFWVNRATVLEEHFTPVLILFEDLVQSEGHEGPQPPAEE